MDQGGPYNFLPSKEKIALRKSNSVLQIKSNGFKKE